MRFPVAFARYPATISEAGSHLAPTQAAGHALRFVTLN